MPEPQVILLRLLLAVLFGAAIGFERQWHQGMAGLRTNALVALGSALFVTVNVSSTDPSPTRVAAQVVSGIGFLCAGVIMRHGFSVIGLNTAATLWCSSGVGVLLGMGDLIPAGIGAVLVIGANVTLRLISKGMDSREHDLSGGLVNYLVRVTCAARDVGAVRQNLLSALKQADLDVSALQSEQVEPGRVEVLADLLAHGRTDETIERLVGKLAQDPEVLAARWEITDGEAIQPVTGPPKGPFSQ